MDVLRAEIEKKRKMLEDKKLVVSLIDWHWPINQCSAFDYIFEHRLRVAIRSIQQSGSKKFFKRSDLLAQEKETYLESQDKQNGSTSTPEKSSDSRK